MLKKKHSSIVSSNHLKHCQMQTSPIPEEIPKNIHGGSFNFVFNFCLLNTWQISYSWRRHLMRCGRMLCPPNLSMIFFLKPYISSHSTFLKQIPKLYHNYWPTLYQHHFQERFHSASEHFHGFSCLSFPLHCFYLEEMVSMSLLLLT